MGEAGNWVKFWFFPFDPACKLTELYVWPTRLITISIPVYNLLRSNFIHFIFFSFFLGGVGGKKFFSASLLTE